MSTSTSSRVAGTCAIGSAALILTAPMINKEIGAAAWLSGLVLALTALAGLAGQLREVGDSRRWLVGLVVPCAAVSVALQMAVIGIGQVANNLSKSSPVHEPFHSLETAFFGLSLLPLGIALAAAAVAASNREAESMPRWLTYATAATATVLVGNGLLVGTEQVPGLLLFLLWLFVWGTSRFVSRRHAPIPATVETGRLSAR